jgi:hypothetical protein
MAIPALFPDAPTVSSEGGRHYVSVPWREAEALHAALRKCGCPTTLCLNPETHQARLELWPGVTPEAVLAVLEVRYPRRKPNSTPSIAPTTVQRPPAPAPAAADPICV